MATTIKTIAAGAVDTAAKWQELPGTAAPNKNATVSATGSNYTVLLTGDRHSEFTIGTTFRLVDNVNDLECTVGDADASYVAPNTVIVVSTVIADGTAGNALLHRKPVAGDAVEIQHAMTIGTGKNLPDGAGTDPFLSLNLNAAGGASPGLTVTGTVTILATTITGIDKLVNTAATNLTIGPAGNAVSGASFACGSAVATPTHYLGSISGLTAASTVGNACGMVVDGNIASTNTITLGNGSATLKVAGAGGITCSSINLSHSTSLVWAASITASVAGTGTGIINNGSILGVTGGASLCTCTGTAAGAGIGISLVDGSVTKGNCTGTAATTGTGILCEEAVTGNLIGAAGAGGIGVSVGVAAAATVTGTVRGTCGAGGMGVKLGASATITGGILLTTDPTSGWISPATIVTKINAIAGNEIRMGNGQGFQPLSIFRIGD